VKAERVRREMLRGAEIALGLPEGSMPAPFFTKVQLWYARHKFVIFFGCRCHDLLEGLCR
jgi:hypothetical protein